MGIYLNPDNKDFERVVKSGEYVDKSGLISYTNRMAESIKSYLASSRPRRFGKSLAVKLLSAYYSKGCDSRTLFEDLEISQDDSFETHLNQYDVISLDIQEMRSVALQKGIRGTDLLTYMQKEVVRELSIAPYIGFTESEVRNLCAKSGMPFSAFQNDMTSMNSSDDVLTLLVHLGYLAYDSKTKEAFIPNLEVRESFESAIQTGSFAETAKAIDESNQLIEATISMDEEAVAKQIEKVHGENISSIAYNSEQSLATVILLAYYKARDEYMMFRDLPTGKGFADIVFVPRKRSDKPAIIIELKWNKDAQTALDQISERKYPRSLGDYHGNILLVGIIYDKKSKKHQCRIEKDFSCGDVCRC